MIASHPASETGHDPARLTKPGKGRVDMRPPIPAEDRSPRVSRVVAEALVRRQGPRRIVSRAARLGLSPVLTRALVAACGASALDIDGLVAQQRAAD